MAEHKIYGMAFSRIYDLYVAKVERKGRTAQDVRDLLTWFTGFAPEALDDHRQAQTTLADFLAAAPELNPNRTLITGVICGVRVEEISEPTMREIRYLDKIIDELAKGKAMEKVLRG